MIVKIKTKTATPPTVPPAIAPAGLYEVDLTVEDEFDSEELVVWVDVVETMAEEEAVKAVITKPVLEEAVSLPVGDGVADVLSVVVDVVSGAGRSWIRTMTVAAAVRFDLT